MNNGNLPQSVIVAGIKYDVAIKPNSELSAEDEGYTLLGECDYFHNTIHVNEIVCGQRKEQVFIHELTHAIFFEAGIEEQDEDMINRVGKVLYQVMKDNPNLLHPLANVTSLNIDTSEIPEEERERIIKTAKLIMSGQ